MTNDQQNLLNHLNAIKTKTEAWVAESPTTRWACYPAVDLDMWASQGITTVAQYEHHSLVCTAFELTRSAFGYKPNWAHLDSLTDDALNKEIAFLNRMCEEQAEHERYQEELHTKAVETAMTVHSGFPIGDLVKLSV